MDIVKETGATTCCYGSWGKVLKDGNSTLNFVCVLA